MLSDKEIIFFQKNGYLIKKSKEFDSINYLQNKVFNLISKKNNNFNNLNKSNKTVFFQKLHKYINKKKLNEIRLSVVNGINSDKKFYKSYYRSATEMLDGLVGNEIAIQKKINISIQIPNDEKSMLPMHSDIYAGESPFEVVVWIPLTNVKKSSHSMFITSPKENPKIALSVYVENGYWGSRWAAPIAGLLIEEYLRDTITRPAIEKRMLEGNLIGTAPIITSNEGH